MKYHVPTTSGSKARKFKAQKNLVMDVTTFDELYIRVTTYHKQENKALVKSELRKIRIAVASPLETYLQMSWSYILAPPRTYNQPIWR